MPLEVAACRRAVILFICQGSTRGSLIPVVSKHRGISGLIFDAMVSADREQMMKVFFILDGAEFRDVGRAIDLKFRTQIVRHADVVERCAKHFWALSDGAADGDSSRAGTFPSEMAGRGVFVIDQILSAGDEVGDRIFLRSFAPALCQSSPYSPPPRI